MHVCTFGLRRRRGRTTEMCGLMNSINENRIISERGESWWAVALLRSRTFYIWIASVSLCADVTLSL